MTGAAAVLRAANAWAPWHERATCSQASTDPDSGGPHPDWWYAGSKTATAAAALEICRGQCPVMTECCEHALDAGETCGIWGGLTAPERARVRRLRREPGQGGGGTRVA